MNNTHWRDKCEMLFPINHLIEVLVGVFMQRRYRFGTAHPEVGGVCITLEYLLADEACSFPRVLEVKHLQLSEEVVVLVLDVLHPGKVVSVTQELLHRHLHIVGLHKAVAFD